MTEQYVDYGTKVSKIATAAKAIAILMVISAHINISGSPIVANLFSAIGSIGVIVFFLISGYYYKKKRFYVMLRQKAKSILLPWLILGSVVWIGNVFLSGGEISILSWIKWQMGYKTYLYFVVVLLSCFILFYFHNTMTLMIAIFLNATSLLFTITENPVMISAIEDLHITNYLNVFNWIGFFALGLFAQRLTPKVIVLFLQRSRIVVLIISVIATITIIVTGYSVGYFSALGWLYELLVACSVLGVCTFRFMYNKWSVSISNKSYTIYLLHMLFVGILGKIYNCHILLVAISNIIVLAVTWLVILSGQYLSRILSIEQLYCAICGIRNRRKG